MAFSTSTLIEYTIFVFWAWLSVTACAAGLFVLKCLYNISPFHPLHKYPGPLLWRMSRVPNSIHHSRGDLYHKIAAFHEQYGPTVRIAPTELSFTAPQAWPQIFNSRPQLVKTPYHFGASNSNKLPDSMIVAPDAEHMRLRRLANPAFLNSGVQEVEPVLQHYSNLLCSQLAKASAEGSQNMVEWFLWTLNDVIGQLALDQEFQCLQERRMHPWPAFLLGILKQTAFFNQLRRFGFPLQLLGPILPKRIIEARDNFFNTAADAVNKRLAREKPDYIPDPDAQSKLDRPDIIGLMLREMKGEKLTEPEIMANSILIVGGGAETTSTCLSATLYHLCKTPRVMKKLRDELRTKFARIEDITIKETANMPYLCATIDESLRIFPVASFIAPRVVAKGGHVIDGQVVAEGTHVSMGQWFMGRSDRFFDDARVFKPERWLEAHHPEGKDGLNIDEVLRPFSLGPRNCIGKLLAVAEARLIIAKLLWSFDIELDGPQNDWVEGARFYILWELRPLHVKLTPVRK